MKKITFNIDKTLKDRFLPCLEYRNTHRDDFLNKAIQQYVKETVEIIENKI